MVWPHGYALDAVEAFTEIGGKTIFIVGDRTTRAEKSCITDDPFGGVNKDDDSRMMEQVRMILQGEEPVDNYFEREALSKLADRYRKMRQCWKLVETFPIPNFVTSDEEEAICDCLSIYQRSDLQN